MKSFAILALAATGLTPALAQDAAPGVTWQQGAVAASAAASAAARPNRPAVVNRGHNRVVHRGGSHVVHRGHNRWVGRGPHRGPRFNHRRFHRGFVLPSFWWGPQFHIMNWQLYGLSQPWAGTHWMRHYDDAYLIDGHGRVHDMRYGMEWDRYGERWGYDANGVPVHGGGYGGDYAYAPPPPPPPPPHATMPPPPHHGTPQCHPPAYGAVPPAPPPPCGYHHGGYAWGWWGWGPVTITETTVTTAPTVTKHTYYVEEKVRVAAPPAKRKYRTRRK